MTKWCVKEGVVKDCVCVCDKVVIVCETWCVTKLCVCVCDRWCGERRRVTKMCVKDGV